MVSDWCRRAARRRTLSPPGSTPPVSMPRCTHSCMTSQMCSRPARISGSVRQDSSLASTMSLIDRSCSTHSPTSSAPELNG